MSCEIKRIECLGFTVYVTEIERSDATQLRREAEREAVRRLVACHFGSDADYSHLPSGAPFVEGHEGVCISVSHCLTHAAMAVGPRPVGIDVEIFREQLRRVAPRFLYAAEAEVCRERPELLLRYWTAKEAVFKAARRDGLTISRIEVDLEAGKAKIAEPLEEFRLSFMDRYPMVIALATSDLE